MPAEVGGKVKVQVPISIKDLSAATGVKVGLLINLGRTRVEFKRMVF